MPTARRGIILAAARDEFAEYGLGGARMDRIAERAGLNKRLIYYYFEDKEKLFQAVLEHAYRDIREAEQQAAPARPRAGRRPCAGWSSSPGTTTSTHPEFLTLLNSENLHRARHLQRLRSASREMNSPLIADAGDDARARPQGRHASAAASTRCSSTSRSPGCRYFYLSNNHTLSAIFGRDLLAPRRAASACSHMCDVILGYVLQATEHLDRRRWLAPPRQLPSIL